jgi:hypothetical protein
MHDVGSPLHAPAWLRVLLLGVVVWLGVRIVGNITGSLTVIAVDGTPVAVGSDPTVAAVR